MSQPSLPDLPLSPRLPELREALARERAAVLVAPPGAGKTTLAPLALLDASWLAGRKVILLEPRRLAARAAASRMADLLGERVGGTVGYRIRLDTRVGPGTRIEVVTEGILTRMLQSDPSLTGVGILLFDEFHERSLAGDLGLALALQCRNLFREGLRFLVMSATLDAEPVAELLGNAPVLRSEGRAFPVETHWLPRPSPDQWMEPGVARAVRRALDETEGDILVFLPGGGEIRRVAKMLTEDGLGGGVSIHPLHGSLSSAEQDRAMAPAPPGMRKVVLATSIAETSLTIEGVRVVVDSGWMRVPRFDPGTGMSRLETVRVTRDAADQRRGRAGRTAPGVCYRLWTRGEDRGLIPARVPEIREADLAPFLLELALWGAAPEDLQWLDPPPEGALAQARELLEMLGILKGAPEGGPEDGPVAPEATAHGREVGRLGHHPRLGHTLLRGEELGMGELACDLAAILSERDFLSCEGRAPDADLRLRIEVLRRRRGGGGGGPGLPGHSVRGGGLARVRKEAEAWRRALADMKRKSSGRGGTGGVVGSGRRGAEVRGPEGGVGGVGVLAALAYPDRVGRRREGERGRFLLRNGRGARFLEPQSLDGQDWIVAVELDGRGREARIFRAAPLTAEEVEATFQSSIRSEDRVEWDDGEGRVVAERVRSLGSLVLSRGSLESPDPGEVARALLEGITMRGLEALPWTPALRSLRERLHFLHRLEPELWPDASGEALLDDLERWLLPFVSGVRRPERVTEEILEAALLHRVAWEDRDRLERWAPSHLQVPSGSSISLDYSDPESPALRVRLQEVFGLTETPRIAGGRVPLTLHLLSPAHRPVQVTRDLESFWREAYFEVRKNMRGRYPKHHWPEDPLAAEPLRGTRRRKS